MPRRKLSPGEPPVLRGRTNPGEKGSTPPIPTPHKGFYRSFAVFTGFRLGAALRPHALRPLTQFSLTRFASAGGALSRVGTLPALHPTVERPPLTSVVRFGGSLRSPALRSHRVRSILALASLLLGHWLRHPQHWFDVANRGVVHPPPRPIQAASERYLRNTSAMPLMNRASPQSKERQEKSSR